MIRYPKVYWGIFTLAQWYGSAFPRALPFSLAAAIVTVALEEFTVLGEKDDSPDSPRKYFLHPYPFQAFAYIAGFMIVFRTQLQKFASKLSDIVVQALTFDYETLPRDVTEDALLAHWRFRDNFIHLVSLLHAVGLLTLRTDFNMENLSAHDSLEAAPPAQLRSLRHVRVEPSDPDADPTPPSSELPDTVTRSRMMLLPGLTRKSDSKGGSAGKKHGGSKRDYRSQGGLTSFLDYFVLRTGEEHAAKMCARMPLPVIGGFTQDEGIALGAMLSSGRGKATLNLNESIHGFLLDNGNYAPAPTERVHTVHAWLQHTLMQRIVDGGLATSSSVQARIHANISDAMGAYEQCKKLNETPFPFPWAQGIVVVLMIFTVAVPFVFTTFIDNTILAALASAAAVQTYIMMNEVANDIEDPFHYDPNQLPLPQMQYRLNERLLAVSKTERPLAFTDVGAIDGPSNIPQLPPDSVLPDDEGGDDDGQGGVSPPQSSYSLADGAVGSASLTGGVSVRAYSSRNGIDPAFQHAIHERNTFWKAHPASTGHRRAPTPYAAESSGGGYLPQWRVPNSMGGTSYQRGEGRSSSLYGGSTGSALPRQALAARNPMLTNAMISGTSGSSIGSERGLYVRAQLPYVPDRRARHIAQWLAAPPVGTSTPSGLTRASPPQSTNAADEPLDGGHDGGGPLRPSSDTPDHGPHWSGGGSSDAPPAVLGTDGRSKLKDLGARGPLPVAGPRGASGVSLGGVSGMSEASSLGDASLGGMHHANTARIMQSAQAFRRAAASRQSTKSSGEEGTGVGGEGGPAQVPAAQRTQDTNLSRLHLTTSSQATHDGAANPGGGGPGTGGRRESSGGTAGGGGGGGGGKAAAEGPQRPQKQPPGGAHMRHPADRRRLPGGTSSSSSSSLDSSIPPLGTASHVRSLEDSTLDSTPSQAHAHQPPQPQHASSSMHRPPMRRTPSADPEALRGVSKGPVSKSPTTERGAPNGVTRPHPTTAPGSVRPSSPLANGGARAASSPKRAASPPNGRQVGERDRDTVVDLGGQAQQQTLAPSPSHVRERQASLKTPGGGTGGAARPTRGAQSPQAATAPEDTNGRGAGFAPQAHHERGPHQGRAHPHQGGNDEEPDESSPSSRRDAKHLHRVPTDSSSLASSVQQMGSMHRSALGSAAASRQSSLARASGRFDPSSTRTAGLTSQCATPTGGAIPEDAASSIYQDIDIPAPDSSIDAEQQERKRGPAMRSAAAQFSMPRDRS